MYPYRRSTLALKPVTYSREPAQTTPTGVALSHRSPQISIFYVRLNAMERRSGSFEVVSFIEWKPKGSLLWVYGKRCVPATVFRACAFSQTRICQRVLGKALYDVSFLGPCGRLALTATPFGSNMKCDSVDGQRETSKQTNRFREMNKLLSTVICVDTRSKQQGNMSYL